MEICEEEAADRWKQIIISNYSIVLVFHYILIMSHLPVALKGNFFWFYSCTLRLLVLYSLIFIWNSLLSIYMHQYSQYTYKRPPRHEWLTFQMYLRAEGNSLSRETQGFTSYARTVFSASGGNLWKFVWKCMLLSFSIRVMMNIKLEEYYISLGLNLTWLLFWYIQKIFFYTTTDLFL